MTMDLLPDFPSKPQEREAEVHALYHRLFPPRPSRSTQEVTRTWRMSDAAVLRAAERVGKDNFTALMAGQWEELEYPSRSEARYALLWYLVYVAGPGAAEQVERLYQGSGLHQPRDDERRGETTLVGYEVAKLYEATDDFYVPRIQVRDRELRDVTVEALEALDLVNEPPRIFRRAGELARVSADDGRAVIKPLTAHRLRGELTRCANWWEKAMGRLPAQAVSPPMDVIHDMRNLDHQAEDRFPPLLGLIEAPALREDGSIIDTPGYDVASSLYYQPAPDLVVPAIPDVPSQEEARRAVDAIEDVIGEFPFAEPADRANAYAELLTPIIRPAIPGPVPMALNDAPQQGTGKSLLVNLVATIATGQPAAATTQKESEAEWRKWATSLMRSGAAIVLIDNVIEKLESSALSGLLTTATWSDRILGVNEEGRWPVRAILMATGNNITVGGDLVRRCYIVRLDAKTSQPWRREDFQHPKLLEYVRERRGELLASLLTMSRAWFVADQPAAASPRLGNYETWAEMVGGILAHAGVTGFLDNLDRLYSQADEDTPRWELFLVMWHLRLGDKWVTMPQLLSCMPSNAGGLRDALPPELADGYDAQDVGWTKRLGHALAKRADMRHGVRELRLARRTNPHSNAYEYRVLERQDEASTVVSLVR